MCELRSIELVAAAESSPRPDCSAEHNPLAELMVRYADYRARWIDCFGSTVGYDEWFLRRQTVGDLTPMKPFDGQEQPHKKQQKGKQEVTHEWGNMARSGRRGVVD